MTDEPNSLIVQLQQATSRWRAAGLLAMSGLLLLLVIQTIGILALRNDLKRTQATAESARKAANAAQELAQEARKLVAQSVVEARARRIQETMLRPGSELFLFPTDQMYREFGERRLRR